MGEKPLTPALSPLAGRGSGAALESVMLRAGDSPSPRWRGEGRVRGKGRNDMETLL
jgi:hypothetical protein